MNVHHAGTHILTLCSRDVCTQERSMPTNCFQEKQTICMSQSPEAQIIHVCACAHAYTHVHTHAHRAQERRVENRQQKGPKGLEAQPERLLAFLLQGEKEQKKRAERLVDSVP